MCTTPGGIRVGRTPRRLQKFLAQGLFILAAQQHATEEQALTSLDKTQYRQAGPNSLAAGTSVCCLTPASASRHALDGRGWGATCHGAPPGLASARCSSRGGRTPTRSDQPEGHLSKEHAHSASQRRGRGPPPRCPSGSTSGDDWHTNEQPVRSVRHPEPFSVHDGGHAARSQ